ncbi:MAG: amidohydrolase family protein [Thermodesulfobacteriota bacterium]
MIIDAHCHLVDEKWLPQRWWEELAKVAVNVLRKMGMTDVTTESVIRDLLPAFFYDPTGERQLKNMEEAGLDRVVIFPVDYGMPLGEPPVPIEEVNRMFADLQKRYPDKFITLVTVDPRRPQARDLVKKALEEWGMRGVKLHQASGFYPNGKETYALLESIADRRVPVVFHTGHIVQPLYSKYCDPMYLDDVCVDFPELTIIAAHMGHGFRDQIMHQGACKTNLWTDCSDWQRRAAHEPHLFAETLRAALDNFTSERVMFGTDGPYLRMVLPDKNFIEIVKSLPEAAPGGIKFTQEEIDAVLGGNAARLYGLA